MKIEECCLQINWMLRTEKGERNVFRIAKQMVMGRQALYMGNCLKNAEGEVARMKI